MLGEGPFEADDRMSVLKVAIVYQYVAHYREPIFDKLLTRSDGGRCSFTLFSDIKSNVPSIKTVDFEKKSKSWDWRLLKNIWLKDRFLWQVGLVPRVALSRDFNVVVFLGNVYYISTWVGIALSKLSGKKVFLWTHGVRVRENGIKAVLRRCFYGLADGLLLYGNNAKNILIQEGFRDDFLKVVFNSMDYGGALDLKTANLSMGSLGTQVGDELKIIFSGRLTRAKRLDFLLRAISQLDSRFSLTVVGAGPALEELAALASELGIDKSVFFVGECYERQKLHEMFSSAHICVIPSAGGLSVLHALSFGVPVITDDDFAKHGPEVEAINPGVTGSFYKMGEVGSLVEEIRDWRKRILSPNCVQIRETCQRVVLDKYTPDRQVEFIVESICALSEKK